MRDKQREETRRRLYHASLEIFARDGVANCRIEDIASKAEVSRAAFYFHFPSKDDVLLQLLLESEDEIFEAIEGLPPDAPLPVVLDALNKAVVKFWSVGERAKLLVDVFAVSLRRPNLAHDRESNAPRDVLGRRFQLAAARGELTSLMPGEVLADIMLLDLTAAMAAWCTKPAVPLEDLLRGVVHLFLNGAKPTAGA